MIFCINLIKVEDFCVSTTTTTTIVFTSRARVVCDILKILFGFPAANKLLFLSLIKVWIVEFSTLCSTSRFLL